MNFRKISFSLVVLLLISAHLAACSTRASGFPTGKFDVSGGGASFEFNRDGTFTYYSGGVSVFTGTYKVDGDVYTETSSTGASTNPACNAPAQYYWDFNGTALSFSVLDDKCGSRIAIYTSSAWIR